LTKTDTHSNELNIPTSNHPGNTRTRDHLGLSSGWPRIRRGTRRNLFSRNLCVLAHYRGLDQGWVFRPGPKEATFTLSTVKHKQQRCSGRRRGEERSEGAVCMITAHVKGPKITPVCRQKGKDCVAGRSPPVARNLRQDSYGNGCVYGVPHQLHCRRWQTEGPTPGH
jgi:hypothetical protein